MKVRTTILLGAGAVSGLVVGVAGPAGAIATGPPVANCTTLGLSGQINSGPDAGTPISGTLCVTDNPFIGTVTGSVGPSFLERKAEAATAASVSLPAASIPVRGLVFERRAIAFGGSEEVSADRVAAAPLYGSSAPSTVFEFDISQGQAAVTARLGASPSTATIGQPAVSYAGTFEGLRFGDQGTWSASPVYH
jgi:hypothetical protein